MPERTFAAEGSAGTIKKLFSGTAVLTLSAVLTKLTGLLYKVPLIALVGTEGMAYFLAANHIYVLLFVISTAGLPVAVAVTVSGAIARGEYDTVRKIYRTASALFGSVGLGATLLMASGAGVISRAVGMPQAWLCIVAISPAVALSCIAAALRGYFQGHQIMLHTAISQMLEAVGKLCFGLAGAYCARAAGFSSNAVAAGAIAGITLGVGLSVLYLTIAKSVFDRKRYGAVCRRGRLSGTPPVVGQLMRLALPVTLSSAVISLSGVIDTALIPNSLVESGFSHSRAYTLFSCYGNMAIPLFSLTPAFISPIAMTLVPLVSSARGRGDRDGESEAVSTALRLTLVFALPASLGLAMFARPVLCLIFASDRAAANTAAPLLALLALSVVPACLITTTNAVLQAKGRATGTILSMLCGTAVKLVSEYILLRRTEINISGAPLSTLLCDVTVVAVNVFLLTANSPVPCRLWRPVVLTALCAIASVGVAGVVWYFTPLGRASALSVIPAVAIAAAIYVATTALCGVLGVGELLSKGKIENG